MEKIMTFLILYLTPYATSLVLALTISELGDSSPIYLYIELGLILGLSAVVSGVVLAEYNNK